MKRFVLAGHSLGTGWCFINDGIGVMVLAALWITAMSGECLMAEDLMLDLSKVANRAFVDQTAGDGKGGWSDQGPTNSLHHIKRGVQSINGIEFRILDEKDNHDKTVLTFDSEYSRSDLKQAGIEIPAQAPAEAVPAGQNLNLYLLHTACWAGQQKGKQVGTITVRFTQGEPLVFPVVIGRDVADWWNPTDLPNAQVAYEENNGSSIVGVYLSKFVLPAERGRPRKITLQTADGPVWIVLATTLTDKALPLAGGPWKVQADAQWKPIDLSDLLVRPGTALDLSFLLDAPAGKHGFIGINTKGELAFANRPDQSVRFLCDSYNITHISDTLAPFTEKEINEFAAQEARMGINVLRPHNLDFFVMVGSTEDGVLNPKQLDKWDQLTAALKKRGIYIYLDVSTYTLFSKDDPWSKTGEAKRFGARLYWDPQVRDIWRKGATALLTHVNPYTGLTLKDDPQVLAMQTRNESYFPIFLDRDRKAGHAPDPLLVDKYRQWLKDRYGTTQALRAAWGGALPADQTLENVPFPPNDRMAEPVARDFTRFCIYLDEDVFLWMQGVLKNIGVRVPITDFNYVHAYQLTLIRDVESLVDMHSYHEHPSDYITAGSSQPGLSALNPNVTMAYLTSMAGVRHLGRPMIISETGAPFWNAWRFESGLCWPSFAALQNWNMVCQFAQTAILTAQNPRCAPLQPFTVAIDPPRLAAQYMAGLLYLRGDVQASSHAIEVRLDRNQMLQRDVSLAMPSALSQLSLLCGFGVKVVNSPHSAPRAPYTPDMVLQATGGDQVVLQRGAANVVPLNNGTQNFDQIEQTLRQKNVLGPNNATDIARGVYQSDTGQILVDTRTQHIQILTPYSEGCTLLANMHMQLNTLSVVNQQTPLAVFIGALDHQPLQQSNRLLLLVACDALNSDMSFLNGRRQVLLDLGRMPVLSRVATLRVTIKHQNSAQLTLWALAANGTRVQRIPLEIHDNSATALINTGTLKNGPTPFFELTTEAPAPHAAVP